MAGTSSSVVPHVTGSAAVELSRAGSRTGAPLCIRLSSRSYAVPTAAYAAAHDGRYRIEGPSCLFVGPVETASQETLEALYCQVSWLILCSLANFDYSLLISFFVVVVSEGSGCLL